MGCISQDSSIINLLFYVSKEFFCLHEHISMFPSRKPKAFSPCKVNTLKSTLKVFNLIRCSVARYKFCSKTCSNIIYGLIIITCHMFGIKPMFIRFSRGRAISITKQISRTPIDLAYYVPLPLCLFSLTTKRFCM